MKPPRRGVVLPVMAVCVLMGLAGFHPTRLLAGAAGVQAMVLAQTMVMVVVLATLLPAMKRMSRVVPADRLKVALAAAGARFFVTALLAAIVAWRWRVHPVAFLTWTGIAYVVMVNLETICLVRWMKRLEQLK